MYLVWGSVDHFTRLISLVALGWRMGQCGTLHTPDLSSCSGLADVHVSGLGQCRGSVGHYTRCISVLALHGWGMYWYGAVWITHYTRLISVLALG